MHFLMPLIKCIFLCLLFNTFFFSLLINQQRSPYTFEYQVSQRVTKHLSALGDDSVMQEIARYPSHCTPQLINPKLVPAKPNHHEPCILILRSSQHNILFSCSVSMAGGRVELELRFAATSVAVLALQNSKTVN